MNHQIFLLFRFIKSNIFHLFVIFLPPIIVFGIHSIMSLGFHAYNIYPWIDTPMHFIGGIAMSYSFVILLKSLQESGIMPTLDTYLNIFFSFTIIVTIAVFWEFLEFIAGYIFDANIQVSLPNTMKDLFLGSLGGLLVCLLFKYYQPAKLKPNNEN